MKRIFILILFIATSWIVPAQGSVFPGIKEEDAAKLAEGLSEISNDATYGFDSSNPIQVGGGPSNERKYLMMICGPEGQDLSFSRIGSFGGFEVIVDGYMVSYDGIEEPVILYVDMYNYVNPKAPKGFRIKDKYKKVK